jgi:serine/threonine protein kinase
MGEVWEARDTRLDRVGAVKFSQEKFSERFEREAKAIGALNHPNIRSLHDVYDPVVPCGRSLDPARRPQAF